MKRLSKETRRRVDLLFRPEEREAVDTLLREQCGDNLPFLGALDEHALERYRFAALKVSGGDLEKLREAVAQAKMDWRDLLMAAEFAHDVDAHRSWMPEPRLE